MVKVIITVRYRDLTGRYRCIALYFKSRVHIGTTAEKESYTKIIQSVGKSFGVVIKSQMSFKMTPLSLYDSGHA